jgi:hypothetical protein
MSQLEADAEVYREKTARLKALRLAHEAANGTAPSAAVPAKRSAAKLRKPGEKSLNLSQWLSTQEKEGRRK